MSKVICDYFIVERYKHKLSVDVRGWIELGWQPLGGVCVRGDKLMQAMVKYKEEDVSDER